MQKLIKLLDKDKSAKSQKKKVTKDNKTRSFAPEHMEEKLISLDEGLDFFIFNEGEEDKREDSFFNSGDKLDYSSNRITDRESSDVQLRDPNPMKNEETKRSSSMSQFESSNLGF